MFQHQAHALVVIGYSSYRRNSPLVLSAGMVVTKAYGIQVWQFIDCHQRIKIMRPNLLAVAVGNVKVETGRLLAVMPFQRLDVGFVVVGKFAISAIAYAGTLAIIPDIAIAGVAHAAGTFRIVVASPAPIAGGPGLFYKI